MAEELASDQFTDFEWYDARDLRICLDCKRPSIIAEEFAIGASDGSGRGVVPSRTIRACNERVGMEICPERD